jgi:hypothetical protein
MGAYGGLNANLNINLPKKWAIQPRYAYFIGFGSDNLTELGTTSNDPYHYTYSVLGFSMIKKLNNGNALVGTFEQAMSSSSLSQWYDMSVGYVIAL